MKLRSAAISPANIIGGAFVAAVIARRPPRVIAIRSRRLRILLAPRIGEAGGTGLTGKNGKKFLLAFSRDSPLDARFFSHPQFRQEPPVGQGLRSNVSRIHLPCVLPYFVETFSRPWRSKICAAFFASRSIYWGRARSAGLGVPRNATLRTPSP